ncbi:MAG: ABC transporter permease [Limnohabitans sp.]|nr:ABC transporter permease [Limnohabitans sp.]
MNFPFYIAKRYLLTLSKNNAINIITGIASIGIIVGSLALFVVLSVFSGLRDFSLSFSNDFDPDLKVLPEKGKTILISDYQKKALQKVSGIKFYSTVVEEKALFTYKNKEQVAYIKGVDNQFGLVNKMDKSIFQGRWISSGTPQVVIGNGISQKLSLGLFDFDNAFEVFVPKPGKGTIDNPDEAFNKSEIIPIGIYAFNEEELDSKYVFTSLELAQELLQYKSNQVTGIEIKLDSLANEDKVITNLQSLFKNTIKVKTRMQQNDSLHKMLNTENTAIYLIFTLVIIMTLFTLAGAIIMMIIDKKHNLKTLENLGVSVNNLRKIFLFQGSLTTLIGGLIGISLGFILVLIQQEYKLIMITDSLAYPVKITIKNTLIVFATILILGFLASLIASSRVSKNLLND